MSEYNLENRARALPKKLRLAVKLPFRQSHPYQDSDAFADLYDSTHPIVARYIFGIGRHTTTEVEDLTAETYERAWKARKRFTGDEDAALGWLLTIAHRLVIDKHRKETRQGTTTSLNEQLTIAKNATPEQQTITQEQRQQLWQLLDELPERSREILVLRYLVGWRVKQIAQHLNLSENNVSTIIRRSLSRLRHDWPITKEGV